MRKLLTIKTGFIAYFTLLSLFSLLIFGVTKHLLNSQDHLQKLEENRYLATSLANRLKSSTDALSRHTIAFVSSQQIEFKQLYEEQLASFKQSTPDGSMPVLLQQFHDLPFTESELSSIASAYQQTLDLSQTQTEAISTAAGEFDDGQGGIRVALPNQLMAQVLVFSQQYASAAANIDKAINVFEQQLSERMNQDIATANRISNQAFWFAVMALALFFAVSGIGLLALYRSIKHPLDQGVELARQLSEGRLSARLKVTRHDELGELLHALNGIGVGLHGAVNQVRERSLFIAESSQTISQGNENLALRTHEQASNVQQTVSTVTELAHTVRQNADNAQHADTLAQQAAQQVLSSSSLAQELLSNMESIRESSRQMSDITTLIRNIAFQTNILALNAAVEAARAGTHGRGFAVVATEVRQLALRSSDASREIETLISRSIEQVQQGAKAAASMESAMTDTQNTVHKVRNIVAEIAQASQEQAAGVEQVSQAMSMLDQITRHNSELVHTAAHTTQQQLEQTTLLREVVSHFELAQGEHMAPDIHTERSADLETAPEPSPVFNATKSGFPLAA